MNTTQIKTENFDAIFARVEGLRFLLWSALVKHGPATTRQLAARTSIDLLTVRPRISELCDLGFAVLSAKKRREGIYSARTYEQARTWHASLRSPERQLEMPLS